MEQWCIHPRSYPPQSSQTSCSLTLLTVRPPGWWYNQGSYQTDTLYIFHRTDLCILHKAFHQDDQTSRHRSTGRASSPLGRSSLRIDPLYPSPIPPLWGGLYRLPNSSPINFIQIRRFNHQPVVGSIQADEWSQVVYLAHCIASPETGMRHRLS